MVINNLKKTPINHIESQNDGNYKEPVELPGPIPLLKPGPPGHIALAHAQMALSISDVGRLHKLSGQPVAVLSHSNKMFDTALSVFQFVSIASGSVT